MSLNLIGLKTFSQRAKEMRPEFDPKGFDKVVPFGISYLDKMLYGVSSDDLCLIGAPSGAGKSELVSFISMNAAAHNKKVVSFALEAYEGEWESRTKYRFYMNCLVRDKGPIFLARYTYLDFKFGLMRKILEPYEEEVTKCISGMDNVSIFYRGADFGIHEFTRIFNAVNDKADLIIVDHLHYFDSDDENENRAFTAIMKQIKNLSQVAQIPVIVVGHLRKKQGKESSLVASGDDFHGTSNLFKICTIAVTLAPGQKVTDSTHRFQTYFRIAKARGDGQVMRYIGLGTFDTHTNMYEKEFILGTLSQDEKKFLPVDPKNIPAWYRERK